jgi:cytochrome c oxidase assembly protein subunit 15
MRRLPTLTARQYERVTLVALVLLFLIVLTGAAVRLTGSGLGCTNWPRCGDSIVAPLELNAWIEFGNRIVTGIVGIPCVVAFVLSFRRRPRRRDLIVLSGLLPLGVLGQAVLGGLTVLFELRPGFVMGHFLLSMVILASAVALYWRARTEPEARPVHDRRLVLLTRALLVWGSVVLFAGTLATAAGPHPGSTESHDGGVVPRIDFIGLDEMIHWHGRTGTVLGLLAVGTWIFARRRGATPDLMRALTWVCVLVAAQGVIGFAQYELELPAGLVWIHVAVAATTWMGILFANAAVGRLTPTTVVEAPPQFWGGEHRTSVERTPAGPS